jgi:hypothetical protein
MGIRILAGRNFSPADKVDKVARVLVNQAFVERFFPKVDPIGQRFGAGPVDAVVGPDNEIIGVVSDAKYRSLREPMIPLIYFHGAHYGTFVMNVRTKMRPASILEPVRKVLATVDPSLPFLEVHTLSEEVGDSAGVERLTAVLASVFGGLAALLAGVGLYGLLAYAMMQRRREIGIRMALGAEALDIAGLTVRQTAVMAAAGILVGMAAALSAGPFVRSLLYGISPWDPKSLAATVVFVVFIAAGATVIPAVRATQVAPLDALRQLD